MDKKQVKITFQRSSGKQQTATFTVIHAEGLSLSERCELISEGFMVIGDDYWNNDDIALAEKEAALACGLARGERFLVTYTE